MATIIVKRRGKRGCTYDFLIESDKVGLRRFDTRTLSKRDAETFATQFAKELEPKYGCRPSVRFE